MRDLNAEWDAIFRAHREHMAKATAPRCEECGRELVEGEILICRRCEAEGEQQAVRQ
jgi:hypothetical protein